jgi:2-amino-4-hydroxy-6-hydroxymethyldihydropteridine diphosphokinase
MATDAEGNAARRAVVALGANLGDREAMLWAGLGRLSEALGPPVAVSAFHETEPLTRPDDPTTSHPAYLNAVAIFTTDLEPLAILDTLLAIDLDLVALDDLILASERLTLPHPEMHKRSFVLAPMAEVWPDWRHPVLGRTVVEILAELR